MRLARTVLVILCILSMVSTSFSARIKDIASIAGIRDNQLIGYGLVVGLDGTGDTTSQTPFTEQSFQNMLLQFGIHLPNGKASQLKNVAAVAISANLPPFARIGQRIDVTVSSIGNSTSLRGGSLLMAPLRGADGKVYAIAQGSVVVSGFGGQGADGSKITVNISSNGSIPNGATVENTVDMPFVQNGVIKLELNRPDFTTVERVVEAVNRDMGIPAAKALDARVVAINVDSDPSFKVIAERNDRSRYISMISRIENINLIPAEVGARVVVNSKTGTIVIGRNVTISPVAVSHGNLSVSVIEKPVISQPQPLSKGKTVATTASQVTITQQNDRTFEFAPGPSLSDLVDAINRVGVAPGDLIAILEAIKAAGALNADLEVI